MWRKNIIGSFLKQRGMSSSAAEINNIMGVPIGTKEGDDEDKKKINNYFNSGIKINPHPEKRYKGGEDAAAYTERMLSVADGVGGWAESGIDPAIYSKNLCSWIYKIFVNAE